MMLVVVSSLLLMPVTPAVAATASETGATAITPDTVGVDAMQQETNSTATETSTPTGTATETESESSASSSTEDPSIAESVTLKPVRFREEFLSVSVRDTGGALALNTSGPFVMIASSERVETARVQQSKASAQTIGDGEMVRVDYDSDAADVGTRSLYTVELFFSDGSSKTVKLYAASTDVASGSEIEEYRPVLDDMLDSAEESGYERSPDGLEGYHTDLRQKAELLSGFLTDQAKRLATSIISILWNPLGLISIALLIALLAYRRHSKRGWSLDIISNDSGRAARKLRELWIKYQQDRQTAAEEPLRELDEVGEMGEIYWNDALGITTVAELAELFDGDYPIQDDESDVRHIGGVDEIDEMQLGDSWLEPVCRDGRLPSEEIALAHGKAALRRMCVEYGMDWKYRDALDETTNLIRSVKESQNRTQFATSDD